MLVLLMFGLSGCDAYWGSSNIQEVQYLPILWASTIRRNCWESNLLPIMGANFLRELSTLPKFAILELYTSNVNSDRLWCRNMASSHICAMIGHDCLILSRMVIDQREKITLALKILVPGALWPYRHPSIESPHCDWAQTRNFSHVGEVLIKF